jgi:hypothetical protein
LPANVQGQLQSVRRVPWDETPMVQAVPINNSRTFQAQVDPGIQDFPVRWHDARFKFSTQPIWDDHPVGLRNEGPPQWPLDILAFGDSFTFCWTALEDCWVQKLASQYGWHVINAGQPGTGSGGQLELMKWIAALLKPRLLIWQWYPNDLSDEFVLAWLNGEAEWGGWPPAAPPIPQAEGFAQYSALYRLIDINLLNPMDEGEYEHTQAVEVNGQMFSFASGEYPHPVAMSYQAVQDGWERHVAYRTEGPQLAADIGAQMLMVFIPTKEEAYAEVLRGKYLEGSYLEAMTESRRRLLELCAEQGWHCLDATPALQEAVRKGRNVYYAQDFHLNPAGNQVLVDLIARYITDHQLLSTTE